MAVSILCYHQVNYAKNVGRRLNIEPSRLESHVRFFARRTAILPVKSLVEWPRSAVCFTFDDAYASTMTHAPEIFNRYGVAATFYAVTDLVGESSLWDGKLAQPLAGWEALRLAQAQGHEIGNHSVSHPHFALLSRHEQIQEIRLAHQRLVSEGIKSESFCFPYGSYNDASAEALTFCNYPIGLSLRKARAQIHHNRQLLPRIAVAYSDALPLLIYKVFLRRRRSI